MTPTSDPTRRHTASRPAPTAAVPRHIRRVLGAFWTSPRAISWIVAVYVILSIIYGLVNPLFEAPDESQHFLFIKHLADGHGLPVQGVESNDAWAQEGSQPPLYYAVGALLISPMDTSDAEALLWFNPHVNMGVPLKEGNKNVYIHTEREAFPFRGATLAAHLLRLLSTLMGVGTVLATYHIVRLAFPDEPALALGAAALNAFTPQFIFISSAINNDNLVMLLSSWALWAMLRLWVRPLNWRAGLAIGALIGAATMAKLSGLALAGLLGLTLAGLWWRRRQPSRRVSSRRVSSRRILGVGIAAGAVMAALAGWWFARNLRLYDDPTGLSAMLDVFGRRQVAPGIGGLLAEFEGLRISYWAIFGWFNILSWPPLYKLLDAILVLAFGGLAYGVARRSKTLPERQVVWGIGMLAWMFILLASLIRWTRMTSGTQGRLLFPGISAMSGLVVVGLCQWLPAAGRRRLVLVLGSGFLIWSAICPFAYIAPAYARPPILAPSQVPAQASPVHITYGESFELMAYELDAQSLSPGGTLHVTAYWRCVAPTDQDYSVYVHLFGQDGEAIGQIDTYPGLGAYPTSLWQAGQIVRDIYPVTVSPGARVPILARIEIGPYLKDSDASPLPLRDGEGRPLGSPVVGRVRVAPLRPAQVDVAVPLSASFGDQIALAGYELAETRAKPGSSIKLTLSWRALRDLDQDYTVFAHLAGDQNVLAGQWDRRPVNGDYPTNAWRQGDVIRDILEIPIKADAAPGEYRLLVGLYQLESGLRLPRETGQDHLVLGQITVSW